MTLPELPALEEFKDLSNAQLHHIREDIVLALGAAYASINTGPFRRFAEFDPADLKGVDSGFQTGGVPVGT